MTRHTLIMAPEVLRELGDDAERQAMVATAAGLYRCVVCGAPGRLSGSCPASVVVLVVRDGGRRKREVQFAHPECSGSRVRMMRAVASGSRFRALPGTAWLRPADTDPPAVFVVGRSTPEPVDAQGKTLSGSFFEQLIKYGFSLLSDPDAPLPYVRGLTAWHTPGRLAIHDKYGEVVWDGRLPSSHAWTYAALRSRRLGFVVASGVEFSGADQARGLYTAITGGSAAGAAICLADPAEINGRRTCQDWAYAAGAA